MSDTPGFESSEEMIRRAHEQLAAPIEEPALLPPVVSEEPEQAARPLRRRVAGSVAPTMPPVPRPAGGRPPKARVVIAIVVMLVTMGIAVVLALASAGH
jgi:hypothetical protein